MDDPCQEEIADRHKEARRVGLSRRLREVIEDGPLSRREIAGRMDGNEDTNYQQLSRWAPPDPKGSSMPETDALLQLATILGINAHWLVTGEGDPHVKPGEADEKLAQVRAILSPPPEDDGDGDPTDAARELVEGGSGGEGPRPAQKRAGGE